MHSIRGSMNTLYSDLGRTAVARWLAATALHFKDRWFDPYLLQSFIWECRLKTEVLFPGPTCYKDKTTTSPSGLGYKMWWILSSMSKQLFVRTCMLESIFNKLYITVFDLPRWARFGARPRWSSDWNCWIGWPSKWRKFVILRYSAPINGKFWCVYIS